MILVVDSGSSKTDWGLVDKSRLVKYFETQGFNPYYMNSKVLSNIIEKDIIPVLEEKSINQVFYYGSGCSTIKKKLIIDNALSEFFTEARIEIEHDLMGAARGLFGDKEGIACILGTGSNSCHYNGKEIVDNIPSFGYMYGDEGSGADLGKKLLTAYLNKQLPKKIHSSFENKYNLELEQILDKTYNQATPVQFLSSFTSFIKENIHEVFFKDLVKKSFTKFLTNQVIVYPKHNILNISFVGSIAFVFSALLKEVLNKHQLKPGKIERNPIQGLVRYHLKHNHTYSQ